MQRFLALTGVSPQDLRDVAHTRPFLSGVLDFFLGHEPSLLAFASHAGLSPDRVASARHTLSRDDTAS